VFVVLKDVRTFVFLNSLVTILVSSPVYVKVAHFCLFFGGVFSSMWFGLCFLWCLYVGYLMFCSTVKPRFTNASDHEQFGLRTQSVSDDVLCLELRTRKQSTSWSDKLGVSASAVFVEK
jgi:hypothetical protein